MVRVRNFRSLVDVTIPLDDVTVLLGENNTGKSSLLDAIALAMGAVVGRRRRQVMDFDFHMTTSGADLKDCAPIIVDLKFSESRQGEWPEKIAQALEPIVQMDPLSGKQTIWLRATSEFDTDSRELRTTRAFLAQNGARSHWSRVVSRKHLRLETLRPVLLLVGPPRYWGRVLIAFAVLASNTPID